MEAYSSVCFDSVASVMVIDRQFRPKQVQVQDNKKKRKAMIRPSVHVNKIIDMRGPHVRVITDFNTINKKPKLAPITTQTQHQHQVLIPKKRKKRVSIVKDTEIVNQLENNEAKRKKRKIDETSNIEEDIVNRLDQMLLLEILAETYIDLQIMYGRDYFSLNFSTIACSYALPLFTKLFRGCDLLKSPTYGVDIVRMWKRLLVGEDSETYANLLVEVLYPVLGVMVNGSWKVREPMPMLRFFDCWKELLPRQVLDDILDDFIMLKLLRNVKCWDPLTENVPIHCWILPWLPLLGRKLERCYGTIYLGFARAIRDWKVSDTSVLSPWKTVFGSVTWEELIWCHAVPKLTSVMKDMKISRASQALGQFRRVQMWASVVPIEYMLQIMDIFFDKWQDCLFQWLCREPDFGEVRKWFLGWKESLHIEIQAHEHIRCRLSIGLRMMNQAAEGLEVDPPIADKDIYLSGTRAESKDTHGGTEMSLKEVIEIHAEINDLEFKPKYGRKKCGLQVYGFGSISIAIDLANQRVFA